MMVNFLTEFIKINSSLIELFKNGIVPLNKLGFHHYDVKANNILYGPDGNSRLIDWGLAEADPIDRNSLPQTIIDRSVAFNMPFSDIFFNNFIKSWLPGEYKRIKSANNLYDKKAGQDELLKVVAINMINKSLKDTGEGHFVAITGYILHNIYKIYSIRNEYNKVDYKILTHSVIIEYIEAVLKAFVDDNGNFNDIKYFNDVFSKNVDVWGWIMAYSPLIDHEQPTPIIPKLIINGICRILLKYCFSPEFATKPIETEQLIAEFKSLNTIANELLKNKSY
jgi:hypothetical protein